MKNSSWLFLAVKFGSIIIYSCKKDNNSPSNTVKDIDGNVYHTVTIGTQVWMVENLKTTKYSDRTAIPGVTNNAPWAALSTPGYCWYFNEEDTYKTTYGTLYNWYTVNTGRLCPKGWHVPTEAEWTVLTDYLGGAAVASGKLKEVGFAHWYNPNTSATNETGFTALPGGYRTSTGDFSGIGMEGYWWSSTEGDERGAWFRWLGYIGGDVESDIYDRREGFSVRCLKDE